MRRAAAARRKLPGGRAPGRLPWIVTVFLLLLGTGTAAYAFWASTTSSSNAAAAADSLQAGSQPAVTANGAALTVSWAGGTTASGRAATGYTITRYAAATGGTGTPATGGCAGTVSTLTCTEQDVPGGMWYYTVTPTIALWTGAESPRSTGTSSDSAAPAATVQAVSPAPNAAGWNNSSPVTVTLTADDGAAGSGVATITYAVDGGAKQTVSGVVATVAVSGDGTHTVTYFATDNTGNSGTAQTHTVRIDATAPAAPGLSVPVYVNSANVAAVPVTGTAEAGATVSLTASDAGAAHSITVTATASGTGTWSASLDLGNLNQGTVTYAASAADAAGNTGPGQTATSTKDTAAPSPAQSLAVPAYVNINNISAVPVSGTAEAGAAITVSAADGVPANTVTGTTTAAGGAWSLTLNLGALNDGPVTYTVKVTDAAGNASTAATASDTKDTVAPVLGITAPMYVNRGSNVSAVPVSGTTEAGTVVNVTVRNVLSQSVTKQVTPTGTTWSTTVDLSTLSDGTLTYTAATTDLAGNNGTATAAGTTSKDTVAPTVTRIRLANGGSTNTSKPSADPGDTVTLWFSESMDLTKFCANWTGSRVAGTVRISDAGTNDSLSFAFTGCTLGTVSLGGNYLSGNDAVFGATGGGSGVIWDAANNALVVTLGNAPNGSSGAGTLAAGVPTGTPAYMPPQTLADVAGNAIGTVSLTAPATDKSGF